MNKEMISYMRLFTKRAMITASACGLLMLMVVGSPLLLLSQSITLHADSYKQSFEGAGISIGLYIGHHFSMNEDNQDEAIRLINKDLNMVYLQDYQKFYPSENPGYFDKRADYFQAAKAYRPGNQVVLAFNNFPANLRTEIEVDGSTKMVLDVAREGIYDSLAQWYFEVLVGFRERGVDVAIMNMVNEPDFNKKHHYGYGDPKLGVAMILKEAIPKLKAMLADPSINTMDIEMPLVMAPSTLSTTACLNYVNYFIENEPGAWEQVDIVGTHQYGGGLNESKIKSIYDKLDGRRFMQSEQHADHSDYLKLGDAIERPHRACLGLSALFNSAVNNGVDAWFYFINNYPQQYHPGGLIRVPWGGSPTPYKHYYAFQQITSTQPINAFIMEHDISPGIDSREVSVFRKEGEDTLYVHASNFEGYARSVIINVDGTEKAYGIARVEIVTTDASLNNAPVLTETFPNSLDRYVLRMGPYSINTLKIAIDPDGFSQQAVEQTLQFEAIDDVSVGEGYMKLEASLGNGNTPVFEIVKGEASVSGDSLFFQQPGEITLQAYHPGGGSLLPSNLITHTFCVNPGKPTVTAVGSKLVSSSESGNQWYLEDTPITGATGPSYEVSEDGNYSVEVKENGCSNFSDRIKAPAVILGLSEEVEHRIRVQHQQGSIEIFSNDNVNIRDLVIYTLDGRVVSRHEGLDTNRITLKTPPREGFYLVRVIDQNHDPTTLKLIHND